MAHGALMHEDVDDVAVVIQDVTSGDDVTVVTLEGVQFGVVKAVEDIPLGHKIALRDMSEGKDVIKPWTPHFEFHGSGVIHKSGTGCIACPCDCPGGIIADNRFPIYDPKPVVKFDWSKAPAVGSIVYVRIRPVCTKNE